MGHLYAENSVCALHRTDDRGNRFKFNVTVQCVAFFIRMLFVAMQLLNCCFVHAKLYVIEVVRVVPIRPTA